MKFSFIRTSSHNVTIRSTLATHLIMDDEYVFYTRETVIGILKFETSPLNKYTYLTIYLPLIRPLITPSGLNGFLKVCGVYDEEHRYKLFLKTFDNPDTANISLKEFLMIIIPFSTQKRQALISNYLTKKVRPSFVWEDIPSILGYLKNDEKCMKKVLSDIFKDIKTTFLTHDAGLKILICFKSDQYRYEVLVNLLKIMPDFKKSDIYHNFLDVFKDSLEWKEKAIPLLMNKIALRNDPPVPKIIEQKEQKTVDYSPQLQSMVRDVIINMFFPVKRPPELGIVDVD